MYTVPISPPRKVVHRNQQSSTKFKERNNKEYCTVSQCNQLCILQIFLVSLTILILANGTRHMFSINSIPQIFNADLHSPIQYYLDDIHIFFSCDDSEKIALYTVINSIISTHNLSASRLYFHILVEYNYKIYIKELNFLFKDYIINDSMKYEIKQFSHYPKYYNFYPNYITENKDNFRICKQMNFARFYFTDIFDLDPFYVKKAIYLDVDMVVQRDIQFLYSHVVNESIPIQAPYYGSGYKLKGYNLFAKAGRHRKLVKLLNISKELKSNRQGFNTGVYIYDLKYWVKNNFTKKYEYYVKLNHEYKGNLWTLGTQPIINLLYIKGVVGKVSRRWNVKNLGYDKRLPLWSVKRGYILHWNGAMKPWLTEGVPGYKRLWLQYVPDKLNPQTITNWSDNWNLTIDN